MKGRMKEQAPYFKVGDIVWSDYFGAGVVYKLSLLFSEVNAEASKYVKQHIDLLPILSNLTRRIKWEN